MSLFCLQFLHMLIRLRPLLPPIEVNFLIKVKTSRQNCHVNELIVRCNVREQVMPKHMFGHANNWHTHTHTHTWQACVRLLLNLLTFWQKVRARKRAHKFIKRATDLEPLCPSPSCAYVKSQSCGEMKARLKWVFIQQQLFSRLRPHALALP